MKKYYSIVRANYVMDDPREILDFDCGDLLAMVGYDDVLFDSQDREEVMDAFEEMESSYSYKDQTLYIEEIYFMEQEQDDEGHWKEAERVYTAEAFDDDLSEAKEESEALTVDDGCVIDALELLKAFVKRFGNSDRGCYDDNRNWFSAKVVTDFIKEFAEENSYSC